MMRHYRMTDYRPATREDLLDTALVVAPRLLGARLTTLVDGQRVCVRITEIEAYHGLGTGEVSDPGSHARMGETPRNATMWGEPGHLYVYLSHGIHSCVNVVTGPAGVAGGLLLRAGEVIEGTDVATVRRPAARSPGWRPGLPSALEPSPASTWRARRCATYRAAPVSASRASRERARSRGGSGSPAIRPFRCSVPGAAPSRADAYRGRRAGRADTPC